MNKDPGVYSSWTHMKSRCYNKNAKAFKDYGARGISICVQWKDDFYQFALDMGPRPSCKHTLDRIENDLGYYKENCRWSLRKTQNRNRRYCKLDQRKAAIIRQLLSAGNTQDDVAKLMGVSQSIISQIHRGIRWRD